MKKVHLIFLFIIFLAFQSCKTVSNRVDKTISEEEKKLSKFLNKTTEELKIKAAREAWKKLIAQGWRKTPVVW